MLYTRESGSPLSPAIVFLHGGGLSSKMWQPQFERLDKAFFCLAPDLPAQGESRAIKPFALDDAAQRVAQVIRERVPAGRAHVVGLSLGGALALAVARSAPTAVARVVVSGASPRVGRLLGAVSLSTLWMLRLMKTDTLVKSTARQMGIPEQYMPLFYDDMLSTATEEFNRNCIEVLMNMPMPEPIPHALLAVVGEKEPGMSKEWARRLAATVPGACAVLAPKVGHAWSLQRPELFADTVRAWVTAAPLPAELRPLV